MPEPINPMSGVTPDKILAKQQYKTDNISQSMFSSATRKDKKVMLPPVPLKGLTIAKLWENIFEDNTSFLKQYHDRRKESDLKIGQWDYAADRGSGSRFVSLVTIVEVPRAGTQTPLLEAHRFAYVNLDDGKLLLAYQISSQTPNVPAGGSFRTEAYIEVTADSAESDCTIAVWGNCKKMSISFSAIQYIATPRAIKEMTAAYRMMVSMISEEFCGGAPAVVAEGDSEGPAVLDEGDSGDAGGGAAGNNSGLGSVFHGGLLLLTGIVTLLIYSGTRSASRTASIALAMLQQDRAFRDGSAFETGSKGRMAAYSATLGSRSAAGTAALQNASKWITEEQALMNAAREAQIQSLRYRWMEQQAEIAYLQSTVAWLNTVVIVMVAAVSVALIGFVYILKQLQGMKASAPKV